MANLYVTSANRAEVRKVLVAAGVPAVEARSLTLVELGNRLRALVADGTVALAVAVDACNTKPAPEGADSPFEPVGKAKAGPASVPPGDAAAGLAAAITAAVQAALGSARPGVDAETVRELVRAEVEAARITPAVVEIRTGDAVRTVEGRVHAEFTRLVTITGTRVQGRRLHAWVTGPSGSGKSFLAKQVADAHGLNYYTTGAIQTKHELVGYVSPNGDPSTLRTPFRLAFEFGGLFAWDDVDGSDAKALVAFNEALSNGRFAFPDKVVEAHPDFVAFASANTWGTGATADYVGRSRIDGASLTRFVRVEVGYDEELERDLVGSEGRKWAEFVQRVRRAVAKVGVKVLVTPRHTLQGAALLVAGFSWDEVERMTLFAGLDRDTEAKIRAAA